MIIRAATVGDAPAITTLTAELGYPANVDLIRDRLARLQGRSDNLVVVADIDGTVVAWLQASAAEILESGARVEITGLVVAAHARRRGVGRALIQRAEAWAQEREVGSVVVRSNVQRTESHPFYASLGFSLAKTQHVYRKRTS